MRVDVEPGARSQMHAAWLVVAAATVLRWIVAASFPLVPDEAYYWEWSRRLASGYFDHPPAIAWVIAGGARLLGDTLTGVRFGPALCGLIASLALVDAARFLHGARAALHAAVVVAVLPLAATGLVLATPDAPLIAASAAMLWALVRALDVRTTGRAALAWWCVAGAGAGFAVASKLTALLALGATIGACIIVAPLRRVLRTPGPYCGLLVVALAVLPVARWNAAHDWIAITYQLDHGLGAAREGGLIPAVRNLGELIGGQAGLTGVIIGVLMAVALVRALHGTFGDRGQLLGIVAATGLGFFALSALRKPVEPNWPAIAYPALILLFAGDAVHGGGLRWRRSGYWFAGILVGVVYAYALGVLPPVAGRVSVDPVSRAHGWRAVADAVDRAAATVAGPRRPFIAADRYQDASELAFHLAGQPKTFALNIGSRRNQYDLWPRFPDVARVGDDLIVVLDEVPGDLHPALTAVAPHFSRAARDSLVTRRRAGHAIDSRRIWVLTDWRGTWPLP